MRFLLYSLLASFLLCGCQRQHEQPATTPHKSVAISHRHHQTTPHKPLSKEIIAELDYYLQRHSIEDEGYDMVARYAEVGDSLFMTYLPDGHFSPLALKNLKGYRREGIGLTHDARGRIYIGIWSEDSLSIGVRIDRKGIYAGEFDGYMQASGHGCYRHHDGTYYEGRWQNDQREGYGIAISPTRLLAGTWKKDRFFGEHIRHTVERIYGIDLSRYQHERGRRRFGINWKILRVTSLGRRIKGTIDGDVDYPIRFAYLKATQGISIQNRYFATDYASAHRYGIPVGAYHFFSPRQSGKLQANYFLSKGIFKKGDLPPVLDIEPTNAQIKAMGGTSVLLREIRVWINVVEQRLHVRPVLYVNQRLVNDHLEQDADLLRDYPVWIARYGEYKPGLHLCFWQLSADARVKGIQTEVDVNVFNGYEPQWEEFLLEATIP